MTFDILYLADLRFPGGTSTALLYELRAAARAGLRLGLIPVFSPLLAKARPPHAKLLAEIRRAGVTIVEKTAVPQARVALIYHPSLLSAALPFVPRFRADLCALVAHHPPQDRFGQPAYPAQQLEGLAQDLFRHGLTVLPVGPTVRLGFEQLGLGHLLHGGTWFNLIDVEDFPRAAAGPVDGPLVIGRHSRPELEKWPEPETARKAYPDDPRFQFRMLGMGPQYLDRFEPVPGNWFLHPFGSVPVDRFLKQLHVYSYFHSPAWIEAFGYGVLEALAAGLPAVVPHYFKDWFEEAALYSTPEAAPDQYEALLEDAEQRARQGDVARSFTQQAFGLDAFKPRYLELVGKMTAGKGGVGAARTISAKRQPVVLVVTSNGVGLGHLTRQLAIAQAFGPQVKVVFFSLSEAVTVARKMGYLVEFRPFHRRLKSNVEAWNSFFYEELRDALGFYQPDLVIFDGNTPYQGLLEAVEAYQEAPSVWVRRGLWRHPAPEVSSRGNRFHLVIEPGEMAAAADPKHADAGLDHVVRVAPVLLSDASTAFSRVTARKLLGLPEDALAGLVQLGAEQNFDMGVVRKTVLSVLARSTGCHLVEARSPISQAGDTSAHERHHIQRLFPLGRYLNAFDFAVTAAGYNSFHENLAAALPTVFVPNTAPEMDLQETRSAFGAQAGLCLSANAFDPYGLEICLRQILTESVRDEMRATCRGRAQDWQGAAEIAGHAALLARLPAPEPGGAA